MFARHPRSRPHGRRAEWLGRFDNQKHILRDQSLRPRRPWEFWLRARRRARPAASPAGNRPGIHRHGTARRRRPPSCRPTLFFGSFVDEQQQGRDKRRQPTSQCSGSLRRDETRAFGIQNKANGVSASSYSSVYILLTSEPADFDAGPLRWQTCWQTWTRTEGRGRREAHGSMSKAGVRSGRPQCSA